MAKRTPQEDNKERHKFIEKNSVVRGGRSEIDNLSGEKKMLRLSLKFVVLFAIFALTRGGDKQPVESIFKWKTVFYGPTKKSEKDLIAGYPYYVRENIIPTAICYHVKTSMFYIAAPRLKPGVVATLNSLDMYETFHLTSPVWTAYPSHQFNELKPWHFPKPPEDDTEAAEYEEGDDCEDNWKKGPGFCKGYYEDDQDNIPDRPYLPEEFLSTNQRRRYYRNRNRYYSRRHRRRRPKQYDREEDYVKIRISSSFPVSESEERGDTFGSAEEDNLRIGLRNVRQLKTLISVQALTVDKCDRLWFIDTGVLDYDQTEQITVQKPSLWVVDVSQKNLFLIHRRFEFDEHVVPTPIGLRGFAVDIKDGNCDDSAVAYIANALDNRIVIYDMRREDAWFVSDHSMEAGPKSESLLQFPRLNVEVSLGITDVAVGWRDSERDKSIFYVPFTSNDLFVVSTSSLKERNVDQLTEDDYKLIGSRGPRSQTESITFDAHRGVLFFVEVQSRSVKCWNVQKSLKLSNIGTVFEHKNLDYPAHVSIDSGGNLWVLSNRFPMFLQNGYNHDSFNVHLYRIVLKDALKRTVCE